MNTELRQDLTPLLKIAQDWFRNSPDQQIPLEEWHKHFKNEAQLSFVSDGIFKVSRAGKEIIPALAAITLGASTQQLAAIMLHHGVTATELARCNFASERQIYIDTPDNSLTPWNTTYQLTKGFAHAPELKKHFLNDYPLVFRSPEMELAAHMSDLEPLWEITKVKRVISQIDSGERPVLDYDFTDLITYSRIEYELKKFSDDEVILLLERSGHIFLDATYEYGFTNHFFGDLFRNPNESSTNKRFIKAFNNINDPELIRIVSQKIFETLRRHEMILGDAPTSLVEMRKCLDPIKYSDLIDSMLLKLAVLTLPGPSGLAIIHPDLITEKCFKDIMCSPQSIVGHLHRELMLVDPAAFKKAHFKAIENTFSKNMPAQDISPADIQALLMHSLVALSHYSEQLDNRKTGFKKNEFSIAAEEHIAPLVKFALAQIEVDYEKLATLPSAAKAYLTTHGLDIKKLPGISNKHRGHLLSDQMGL
jgi:hypothetical protein